MTDAPLTIAQMLESGGPGGAETVLLQLTEELLRRGHRVVPVRCRDGETWLDDRLKQLGLEPRYLPLRRAIDPGAVLGLRELLREDGVDVVHSHEFTMAVYGAAACRLGRLPIVTTMHGKHTEPDAWRRRAALRWAFRRSAEVVCVSEATRHEVRARLGRGAGELGVVPNGIPVREGDGAAVTQELSIGPDEVVILAVGNLRPWKGHAVLLQALEILDQRGDLSWRLLIAGTGDERENLTELAERAGLADRVHLLGHRTDVPDLQAAAHILCMPSLWEGLPLAVLEGMAAGNCVVASATSGIPEAVTDGVDGLLVTPGDAAELAGALERAIRDPGLREELGRAARETLLAEFSIQVMADRYEALYRSALRERSAASGAAR